jgi:DNA-directed RNA polymerase subunit H (RpoH/RPB5)
MDRRLGSALAAVYTNVADAFARRGYSLDDDDATTSSRPARRYDADDPAACVAVLRAHARVDSTYAAQRIAAASVSCVAAVDGALDALRAFRVSAREPDGRRVLALVADAYHERYESPSEALGPRMYLSAAALATALDVAERELGAPSDADVGPTPAPTQRQRPPYRLVLVLWHAPRDFTPSASLRGQLAKHARRATLEVFTRVELLVDIFDHVLQPPLIRLAPATSAAERAYLAREYDALPGVDRGDAVVRRLAAPAGAVLEYVRVNERTGRTAVYRRVSGATPADVAVERARWRAAAATDNSSP